MKHFNLFMPLLYLESWMWTRPEDSRNEWALLQVRAIEPSVASSTFMREQQFLKERTLWRTALNYCCWMLMRCPYIFPTMWRQEHSGLPPGARPGLWEFWEHWPNICFCHQSSFWILTVQRTVIIDFIPHQNWNFIRNSPLECAIALVNISWAAA